MSQSEQSASLEEQIAQWRGFLLRRRVIHSVDIAELEDHLREQIAALVSAGLAKDEAFLVAVKRMGALDGLTREFAREHSERLWKQLVVLPEGGREPGERPQTDAYVAFGLAVAAGVLVKVPELFGLRLTEQEGFYTRNLSFFVLPLLAGYFAWKRRPSAKTLAVIAILFAVAGIFANVYPFKPCGFTEVLSAIHLPIVLWVVVGVSYAGSRWRETAGRMDFFRFSGELSIYYVLIALGGGVFTAFLMMMFQAIGINAEWFIQSWLIPCGAAGAVLVASWLVEAKQSVIENMAPVLTRLFTPLFAILLVAFLVTMLVTGRALDIERELLIAFDLLLVVVLGLLLYSVSARDAQLPRGVFDVMQVVLVVSALLADAAALWAISARISEFGYSPNRVAGLGVNVILLANLAWSAVLYIRFLRGRGPFTDLERWQTNYLPVYAVWGSIVVIIFPVLFGYV
jgi:hypothetical protein